MKRVAKSNEHVDASRVAALVALAMLGLALPAHAAEPVLHVYIEPDAAEDLQLETTTFDGQMPAAMNTESGVVEAPKASRDPAPAEKAYGGSSPSSIDATYQIDSDTRQPEVVQYDDPFSPAVTPFKRLFAYDGVASSLELVVGDKSLVPLSIGGEVQPGDDAFYGDMFVDVDKNVPARIPSVGPGARVLAAHVEPADRFELLRDGAENWYLRMDRRARVRLVLRLAIDRRVFGSEFRTVSWSGLAGRLPELPPAALQAAGEVADHIGITRVMRPREVVSRLVAYFRSFQPSDVRPTSRGARLYRDLSFSQKGVCRHRSYAFMITSIALGVPARMIRNEAHAWVEVYDGRLWHRIDLGGAASRLEAPPDDGRPHHVTPDDPYGWPEGSDSGQDLAERQPSSGGQPGTSGGGAQSGSNAGAGAGRGATPLGPPLASADGGAAEDDERRPRSELTVSVGQSESLFRGNPLEVSGEVVADGQPCAYARVDVALSRGEGPGQRIGSLAADEAGRYSGQVVVPLDTDVGEYDLRVSTPGDARCGRGETR